MAFEASPETPGATTTPQAEPVPASPGDAGSQEDFSGGIDLVRVPHPDFDPEPGPLGGQQNEGTQAEPAADPNQGEPTPQGAEQAQGGETPPDSGTEAEPGQAQGQAAEPYMKLKHRGREIAVDSVDKARALAQMGLDYSAKTHAIAPIVQRYPALIQALSNPDLAARVDAVLNGQAIPGQDPGQAPQGQQAQPPAIMVTDPETGQKVPVDQGFIEVLDQYFTAKGLGKPEPDQALMQRLEALEATAPAPREVADRQVEAVSQHIKATLGFDDFKEAVPMIIEDMAAQGIGRGDPRDNPQTWIDTYKNLRLTGRFTGKRETTPKPKTDLHQTKVQAAGASPAPGTKQGGIDWKAMTKKAMETGQANDMVAAVSARISHPDFE